jgi:LytS/YehU family sensor histidine kinase
MSMQKEKAYEYLSNFAQLLRLVLENSNKSFLPLEDEIRQLKLYIELEETRFIDKFNYSFDIDPELSHGVFEIPGMVLQPLVENAIVHGLSNRKGDGGMLSVKMMPGQNVVFCEITDNGVGRAQAAFIKSLQNVAHESAAMHNISQRLEILQAGNNPEINIEIIDLFDQDTPAGTLVRVMLPYK